MSPWVSEGLGSRQMMMMDEREMDGGEEENVREVGEREVKERNKDSECGRRKMPGF
jgi:hypothetical protein